MVSAEPCAVVGSSPLPRSIESRELIRATTAGVRLVTDSPMRTEWKLSRRVTREKFGTNRGCTTATIIIWDDVYKSSFFNVMSFTRAKHQSVGTKSDFFRIPIGRSMLNAKFHVDGKESLAVDGLVIYR